MHIVLHEKLRGTNDNIMMVYYVCNNWFYVIFGDWYAWPQESYLIHENAGFVYELLRLKL
jgi:hypothetical protein